MLRFILRAVRRFRERAIYPRPSRIDIAALPLFEAITLDHIVVVDSPKAAAEAWDRLSRESVVGFDTESRPTFAKGEVSTGPHVVQLATDRQTYVFMLHDPESRRVASQLIALKSLKKVGFGLGQDRRLIPIRLHVQPKSVVDLERTFIQRGYGRGIGVKAGVAILLGRRLVKSKRISTSNWSRHPLIPQQLLYAANDAYAALRVHQALEKTAKN